MEHFGSFCLKEDPSFKIDYKYVLDDNNGQLYFWHPLTGQWVESLNGVFVGWSEQNEEANRKWKLLVERIDAFFNDDEDICQQKLIQQDTITL